MEVCIDKRYLKDNDKMDNEISADHEISLDPWDSFKGTHNE